MDAFWSQVSNYGFPMLITVFLLVRIEKKLDELTAAILQLGKDLAAQID